MTRRYTPPPSPARRSPSYVFLPEKPRPQAVPAPAVTSPGTPPVAPGEGREPDPDDRTASVERSKDRRKSVSTKVEHISVLQRWFQSDYHHHPHPRHYLPRLSWSLPPRRHPPQPWGERESDLGTGEEQLQRWRHTGEDLRHVADQFQLTNAKVSHSSTILPRDLINRFIAKHLENILRKYKWKLYRQLIILSLTFPSCKSLCSQDFTKSYLSVKFTVCHRNIPRDGTSQSTQ